MPLTDEEKIKIRHHLGYLNVQEAATFVLGTPAGVETQFLIEGAMNRILEGALPMVRSLVQKCDITEEQMLCGQENMAVKQIGEITTNVEGEHREQRELRRSYKYWRNSLANLMGIPPNPFDQRNEVYGLGGISVAVRH